MQHIAQKFWLPLYLTLTFLSSWSLWAASGVLVRGGGAPALDLGWLVAQVGVFCPSLWALAFTAMLRSDLRRHCLSILLCVYLPAILLGLSIAVQGVNDPNDLSPGPRTLLPAFALGIVAVVLFSRRLLLVRRSRWEGRAIAWVTAAAVQLPLFFLVAWMLLHTAGTGMGEPQSGLHASWMGLVILFSFDAIFGGALGEELGWRAFVLPRLLADHSPLASALILGVIWGLWHLPIDLTAGFGAAGAAGVCFRLLFTCPLSVIIIWYFIRSGHGVATSFLIHTTLNWLPIMQFSHYQMAMGLLMIAMLAFGIAVVAGDSRFNRSSIRPD